MEYGKSGGEYLIHQMVATLDLDQFKKLMEIMVELKQLNQKQFIETWIKISGKEKRNINQDFITSLQSLFVQIDYDQNGTISWEEFSGNLGKTTYFLKLNKTVECSSSSASPIRTYSNKPEVTYNPEIVPKKMVYLPSLKKVATLGNPSNSGIWNPNKSNYGLLSNNRRNVNNIIHIPKLEKIVSCSSDPSINIYGNNLEFQDKINTRKTQLCLNYDNFNGVLYSGGVDNVINIFSLEKKKKIGKFRSKKNESGHKDYIMDLIALEDLSWIFSGSLDKSIKLWDTRKHVCKSTKYGHKQGVTCLSFSYEYKLLLSSGSERYAFVWNHLSGDPLLKLEHRRPLIGCCAVEKTPELITVDELGIVKIWDVRKLKGFPVQCLKPGAINNPLPSAKDEERIFQCFCYNYLKKEIIVCGESENNFWRSVETKDVGHIKENLVKLQYNRIFMHLLIMEEQSLIQWNLPQNKYHKSIKISEYKITDFQIVLKGRHILSVSIEGEILLHNLIDGSLKKIKKLSQEIHSIHKMNGYKLVINKEFILIVTIKGNIFVLELDSFQIVDEWKIERKRIVSHAIYDEKNRFLIFVFGNMVEVYDVYEGVKLQHCLIDSLDIISCELSTNLDLFVSTNAEGYIQIYNYPLFKLMMTIYVKPELNGPRYTQICEKSSCLIVAQSKSFVIFNLQEMMNRIWWVVERNHIEGFEDFLDKILVNKSSYDENTDNFVKGFSKSLRKIVRVQFFNSKKEFEFQSKVQQDLADSTNILKTVESYFEDGEGIICYEDYSTTLEQLFETRQYNFNHTEITFITSCLLNGLFDLHSKSYVCSNLNLSNIVRVDDVWKIKLSRTSIKNKLIDNRNFLNVKFISPELVNKIEINKNAIARNYHDIWSFAVVILILVSKNKVFEKMNESKLKIFLSKLRYDKLPKNIKDSVKDITINAILRDTLTSYIQRWDIKSLRNFFNMSNEGLYKHNLKKSGGNKYKKFPKKFSNKFKPLVLNYLENILIHEENLRINSRITSLYVVEEKSVLFVGEFLLDEGNILQYSLPSGKLLGKISV